MRCHTHAAAGLVFGLVGLKYGLAAFAEPGFLLFTIFGALLPDIDHPKSKLGRKIPILPKLLKHRGMTHSIFGCVLSATLLFLLLNFIGIGAWSVAVMALLLGFTSHLVLDSLNPTGIHWLRPFHKLHVKGPIGTGGIGESAVFVLLVFALGFLLRDFGLVILKII